ncbi:hypothetical protein FRAHR75_220036 [Frankia sp. Hr75.2]|nr:hypothetical protein FRAHR75_220036 [Frankia sp. Hr75.2]
MAAVAGGVGRRRRPGRPARLRRRTARRQRRGAGHRRNGRPQKGERTVRVQRQHTGTGGRIENARVAVYLAYAADRGHAFVGRPQALLGLSPRPVALLRRRDRGKAWDVSCL